jgi:ABC-type multidrug transport system ATPase subunit
VQDVSFRVEQGEIFGIIGPNGAGRTTTVECISGLDPQARRDTWELIEHVRDRGVTVIR